MSLTDTISTFSLPGISYARKANSNAQPAVKAAHAGVVRLFADGVLTADEAAKLKQLRETVVSYGKNGRVTPSA